MSEIATTYHAGGTAYDGWRKIDILDMIIDQDPKATPLWEMTGITTATQTRHNWLAQGVKSRTISKMVEGAAFSGQAMAFPTPYGNTCQIQYTPVEMSRTMRKAAVYGAADPWDHEMKIRTREHRANHEYALWKGNEATGATNAAREMNGVINAILDYAPATNTTDMGGSTFHEDALLDILDVLYQTTDAPMVKLFTNTKVKRAIDKFSASGAVRNMDITVREVVLDVSRYFTSTGIVEMHLSRDLNNNNQTTGEVVVLDIDQIKKAYYDRTHIQPVAKTFDGDLIVMVDESTLEFGNPEAHYYMSGLDSR